MIALEHDLTKKLKQMRVHVDAPDADTVLMRNVPANGRFFNKSRTNLLIKRPRNGMPFLVCVDEDLNYTGTDVELSRAFVAGQRQQGWRVLFVSQSNGSSLEGVIEEALNAVGFDGREPELKRAKEPASSEKSRLIENFGTDLTDLIEGNEPTVGREEKVEQVAAAVLQWRTQLPLIVGVSGVGKTNLIFAVARKLKRWRPALKFVSLDAGVLMAGTLFDSERESLLGALLNEAGDREDTVLVIEHLEMALTGVPRGGLLLGRALDRGVRLIGTTLPGSASRFQAAPLKRRVELIELSEMSLVEAAEVIRIVRDRIASHHLVAIPDSLLDQIVEIACGLEGHFPAKAISLLDAAAARAALAGESELSLYDVHGVAAIAASESSEPTLT